MSDNQLRVGEIPAVLVSAARILGRYWAPFIVIACVGVAFRNGALWLAIFVSKYNGFAGQLILIFAPLGFLCAMVAMLYLTRPSLTNVRELTTNPGRRASTEKRELRLVDVAVSVLVPFLAVYVSYGLLQDDMRRFTNDAAYDELTKFGLDETPNFDLAGRLGIYSGVTVLAIVAIAWVLRFALGKLEKATSFLAIAFVGALVEVYYTSRVAQKITQFKAEALDWVQHRRSADAVISGYGSILNDLGRWAKPVDATVNWAVGVIGSIDAVVIVPLAWLTVGAVILGHKLTPAGKRTLSRTGPRYRAAVAVRRVPGPAVGVVREFASDVRERWSAFWNGLRLMATAGLVPMLTFSLVFLLVLRVPWLLGESLRWAIGPTRTRTWLAFSPLEDAAGLALTMVLAAALLAAAIDWLLGPQLAAKAARPAVDRPHLPPEWSSPSGRQQERYVPGVLVENSDLDEGQILRRDKDGRG